MVVAITSECMGTGDDVLGRKLMGSFVYSLTQLDELPATVLLYNGGAHLSCEGSAALEDLRGLAVCAKSWDFEVASAGVAARNAWHNQPGRLGALGLVEDATSADPFVFLPAVAARMATERNDGSRPRAVVVGHFPHLAALAERADLVAGSVVADAALAREVVTCGAPLHGCGALEHVLVAARRSRAALEAASPM